MEFENLLFGSKYEQLFNIISTTSALLKIKSYIVGGFVRDNLIKLKPKKDIDIVAVGSGIELASEVQKKLRGSKPVKTFKTYGTAMIQWKGMEIEFVGARKESYSFQSRNPRVFSGTLEDDLNRRDFTINAIAISLNKIDYGNLFDPFNGFNDLKKGIIRTPLNPNTTYSDDPLRMLRAIRFATELSFEIEKGSLDAITRNSERINIISKERIVGELTKILCCEKPSKGFYLLEKTKLLDHILPELVSLKGIEEINGKRHKDNFYHTLEVVDNLCLKSKNIWLRWAALFHDIGKASTRKFDSKTGWTFHNHEYVGSKMVYKIFKRLKMPLNEKIKYVQKIILMSSRPIIISEEYITDSAVRRLIFDAGADIDDLITLCEADITTKNQIRFRKYLNNFKIVREKIVLVEEKDQLRNFQPPINGKEIMNYFGLGPSKKIGLIKDAIKEAILDGEISNEFEAAFEKMKNEGERLGLKPHE